MGTKISGDRPRAGLSRREFIRIAAMAGAATLAMGDIAAIADTIAFPFVNGERRLARFPQKRDLILQRTRPPLLETPLSVFDEGVFTPNDAFYVRWHLPVIPTEIDIDKYRLKIHGHVKREVELTMKEILHGFAPVEMAAVNQCSGNSRGFFDPRVPGGQWGNGAMGNARWTGVRLKDLLNRAGVRAGAVQVRFRGLDKGEMPETPLFMKSIAIDHAMDGEVMAAYGMNGEQLPMLNGFPLRMVVPGWYATYWVKMLAAIEVLDKPDGNFWMTSAYKVPDNSGGNMKPGEEGVKMTPISTMLPRSFITNLTDGARIAAGRAVSVRGVAFGGNTGVAKVMLSSDRGKSWSAARLDRDYGKYSLRRWDASITPAERGDMTLMTRAINRDGLAQPLSPNWNPGGFMRNVVERVRVRAV